MNRSRNSILPTMLVAGLVVTACGSTASPTTSAPTDSPSETASEAPSEEPEAEEARVRIESSAFDPAELTVAAGTEVLFINADGFAHTVTEGTDGQPTDDPIVDEEVDQNGTVSVTFDEPGTYDITCRIHPSMNMTVTVEG